MSIQTIASRSADPLQSVVVSVTKFLAGTAYNIIPEEVELAGTIRTLNADMRKLAVDRLRTIVESVAAAHDVAAEFHHMPNYPVTFNHAAETEFAADIAAAVSGGDAVDRNVPPTMGGEDFSYMLEARPGAFIFMGNGDTAGLHHPAYDFNDEAIPHGVSYWVRLVETSLAD
jgi:hippurate hydrolase